MGIEAASSTPGRKSSSAGGVFTSTTLSKKTLLHVHTQATSHLPKWPPADPVQTDKGLSAVRSRRHHHKNTKPAVTLADLRKHRATKLAKLQNRVASVLRNAMLCVSANRARAPFRSFFSIFSAGKPDLRTDPVCSELHITLGPLRVRERGATFPTLASNDKPKPQNRGSSPREFAQASRSRALLRCATGSADG
jgi:hypothetical protein